MVQHAPRALRTVRLGALGVLAAFSPAAAQISAPCSTPAASAEALFAGVEAGGYHRLPVGEAIPSALAEGLMWINTVPYLAGDSGGAALGEILDLQARKAANYARLRPTPMSATSVFAGEDGVALIRWQDLPQGEVLVTCAATTADAGAAPPVNAAGGYGLFTREVAETGDENLKVIFERYRFDDAAIRAAVAGVSPPAAVLTVEMRFSREVLQ